MTETTMELQPGERIVYQAYPNRKWYAVAWKIVISAAGIIIFTMLVFALFANLTVDFFTTFLPEQVAKSVTQILCLGIVPLLFLAWVVEDLIKTFTATFVLTDRRFWVKGSPYTWNCNEIPLDDIATMTLGRGAVFIRVKSNKKIHVHMFSDARSFVKAYERLTGKEKPAR